MSRSPLKSPLKLAALASAAATVAVPTTLALQSGTAHAATVTFDRTGEWGYSGINCNPDAKLKGHIVNRDDWRSGGTLNFDRGSCGLPTDIGPWRYKVRYKASGVLKETQGDTGPYPGTSVGFAVYGTIIDSCFGDSRFGYWAGITPGASNPVHTGCNY